jgi:GTPase
MEKKLMEAVERLEQVAARIEAKIAVDAEASIGKIVATVAGAREGELERKLADAEAKVAAMQAASSGRKTAGVGRMLAKEGAVDEGALDAALASLTVEQRLAVKGELMRAGLVG